MGSCIICKEVFQEAVILNCQHVYCNRCVTRGQLRCPYCREVVVKIAAAQDIRESVAKMEVMCPNGMSFEMSSQDFEPAAVGGCEPGTFCNEVLTIATLRSREVDCEHAISCSKCRHGDQLLTTTAQERGGTRVLEDPGEIHLQPTVLYYRRAMDRRGVRLVRAIPAPKSPPPGRRPIRWAQEAGPSGWQPQSGSNMVASNPGSSLANPSGQAVAHVPSETQASIPKTLEDLLALLCSKEQENQRARAEPPPALDRLTLDQQLERIRHQLEPEEQITSDARRNVAELVVALQQDVKRQPLDQESNPVTSFGLASTEMARPRQEVQDSESLSQQTSAHDWEQLANKTSDSLLEHPPTLAPTRRQLKRIPNAKAPPGKGLLPSAKGIGGMNHSGQEADHVHLMLQEARAWGQFQPPPWLMGTEENAPQISHPLAAKQKQDNRKDTPMCSGVESCAQEEYLQQGSSIRTSLAMLFNPSANQDMESFSKFNNVQEKQTPGGPEPFKMAPPLSHTRHMEVMQQQPQDSRDASQRGILPYIEGICLPTLSNQGLINGAAVSRPPALKKAEKKAAAVGAPASKAFTVAAGAATGADSMQNENEEETPEQFISSLAELLATPVTSQNATGRKCVGISETQANPVPEEVAYYSKLPYDKAWMDYMQRRQRPPRPRRAVVHQNPLWGSELSCGFGSNKGQPPHAKAEAPEAGSMYGAFGVFEQKPMASIGPANDATSRSQVSEDKNMGDKREKYKVEMSSGLQAQECISLTPKSPALAMSQSPNVKVAVEAIGLDRKGPEFPGASGPPGLGSAGGLAARDSPRLEVYGENHSMALHKDQAAVERRHGSPRVS